LIVISQARWRCWGKKITLGGGGSLRSDPPDKAKTDILPTSSRANSVNNKLKINPVQRLGKK